MKISIVIPVYNVARYIRRCLDSVMSQTFSGELECIIVDDASPDNSMDIVRDMLKSYEGTIIFKTITHDRNKGLSGARNTGIRHATGEYLYFLDSDDEITPDCIESLAQMASVHPGTDIVQGNLVVTDPLYKGFELTQFGFPEYTADRQWIQRHMLDDIPVTAWNKLIRKKFLLRNNLWFKEGLIHEDEHWKYLSFQHVESMAFCMTPTYIYYRNADSLTEVKFKDRNFESLLRIYREFLADIPFPHQYRKDLTYAVGLSKRLNQLKEPEKFMADFKAFIKEQLHSPKVPFAAKPAMYNLLHPSKTLVNLCRVFYRPAYIYMKHFKRVG